MSTLNPQAVELNEMIASASPGVSQMLSRRGQQIFFPKKGILGQSAQARGAHINATIGTALENDGTPLGLGCIKDLIDLPAADSLLYAPSFGKRELRQRWRAMMEEKNPTLAGKSFSQPVVTQALTHGLSTAAYLFLDEADELIIPELYWGNYNLIFKEHFGVSFKTFNTFVNGGFDVAALEAALLDGPVGKKVVLLNFPNNPTGYTVTESEADAVTQLLAKSAEAGNQLVVLLDDAYFGLVFEEGVFEESLFSRLVDLHENVLAVKVDGPTKEDYVWGFRVGFITFGIKGGTPDLYEALESKAAGAIRGNISNAPAVSQSLLMSAFSHPDYRKQKKEKFQVLKKRCETLKRVLAAHPEYTDYFVALPFNSGYFMCVQLVSADAEKVRQLLLSKYDTGVIAQGNLIRIAFSSTPVTMIEQLFSNLYEAVKRLSVTAQG